MTSRERAEKLVHAIPWVCDSDREKAVAAVSSALDEARAEAFEEAAKVAESRGCGSGSDAVVELDARTIAAAIRARGSKP